MSMQLALSRSVAIFALLAPAAQGGGIETELFESPTPVNGDLFGSTLAVDGARLAVWSTGLGSQALSLWARDAAGQWIFEDEQAPAFAAQATFNASRPVNLVGERAVVTAGTALTTALFERAADGSWLEASNLIGAEPNADLTHSVATVFGERVAISIGILFAGRVGIFERVVDGSWPEVDQRLFDRAVVALGSTPDVIAAGTVALSGNEIVLLEPQPTGGWGIADVLQPPRPSSKFGTQLDLEGDLLVTSAGGIFDGGIAVVYERGADGRFQLAAQRQTPNGEVFDTADVQVLGDLIVASQVFGEGRLAVFERAPDGAWALRLFLRSETGGSLAGFGGALSLGPGWCVSGRPTGQSGTGSVASFDLMGLYRKQSFISATTGGTQKLTLRPGLKTARAVLRHRRLAVGNFPGPAPGRRA